MIDFTHKKRPDFVQLILILAVVCLVLGAITPAASAVEYEDLTYSFSDPVMGNGSIGGQTKSVLLSDGSHIYFTTFSNAAFGGYHGVSISQMSNTDDYKTLPNGMFYGQQTNLVALFWLNSDNSYDALDKLLEFVTLYTNIDSNEQCAFQVLYTNQNTLYVYNLAHMSSLTYDYYYSGDSLNFELQAFALDDPAGMYVLSLDGSLLDTTYTVGINRYTSEFEYLIDSYAYSDGSGSYTFTGSRSLTLPIFYNSFTNMPYSYELSVNVNDENGYLDERYLVYWSDLGGLYDIVPDPLVPTPTPTVTFVPPGPVVPSDIIPHPDDLNNTVNITGWYQDQGFEGNNITAPIYSGIRGWFNENLIPVIDFFLTPTNYVATVISDSSETSTDGISYITEELGSYAAPFNIVGGYVVLLVPEVVWIVVFAALSIGYVVLLIRVSTGSIKDTIGRFLGGK